MLDSVKPGSNKIQFKNSEGEELAGSLELPQSEVLAYAIFAHCFTCSKDSPAASRISRGLRDAGIAVLRFDFTGLGGSDGDFGNTNFSSNVDDLIAAADYLKENFQAPSLLLGHSFGGAAVLAATSKLSEVKGVVTIGAPADPQHVEHLFGEQLSCIQKNGEAEVNLAGRNFKIKKQFIDDIESQKIEDIAANLNADLLIMHSPIDQTVGIDQARMIYQAAKHPKSFISLAEADHLITNRADAEYVAQLIFAWSKRLLA